MKRYLPFTLCLLWIASVGTASETNNATVKSTEKSISTPTASLGYVILYVKDVSASLAFYEQAFGFSRRFFNDDHGRAYGGLDTGGARLAFYNLELVNSELKLPKVVMASPEKPPLGFEIALLTPDVPAAFSRAVKAGAVVVSAPARKPWGQTVACVRDKDGHLIELATPMP